MIELRKDELAVLSKIIKKGTCTLNYRNFYVRFGIKIDQQSHCSTRAKLLIKAIFDNGKEAN